MDSNKGKQPKGADEPDTKTPDKEPDFKTPEEVAAADDKPKSEAQVDGDIGAIALAASSAQKVKHKFKEVGLKLWPSTKKQKIIGGVTAVIIIVLGVAGVFALKNLFKNDNDAYNPEVNKIVTSNLTGLEVKAKVNKRKVIAMMIENSPDARPQSGLDKAGVVFEAIAEGGITRYCALFQDKLPSYVGPVRSVRPYYVNWLAGFDAAVGHAGGSAQGLAKVASLNIDDLDYTKASAYQRVSDRFAPHNLYANLKQLQKEAKQKGFKASKFDGFQRKPELKNLGKTKVKNIRFDISSDLYNPSFKYVKKTNSYKRYLAGQPHKDQRSGKFIKPKVVVGLVTGYSQSGIYSVYKTTGKGRVFIFQDGKVQVGTWKKKGPKKPLRFFDKKGGAIRLNPGKTWITALANKGEAQYGP